jgi:hypothetical protein
MYSFARARQPLSPLIFLHLKKLAPGLLSQTGRVILVWPILKRSVGLG